MIKFKVLARFQMFKDQLDCSSLSEFDYQPMETQQIGTGYVMWWIGNISVILSIGGKSFPGILLCHQMIIQNYVNFKIIFQFKQI